MLALIILVIGFPLSALCTVWEVSSGGSIQSAVGDANPGDTILVHEGTYAETVVLYGKGLTIASQYLMDSDPQHIGLTIIRPDSLRPDTGSCFVFAYHEFPASRLVGLRLREGRGTRNPDPGWDGQPVGGTIWIHDTVDVSVEHCIIENSAAFIGGGLCAWGSEGRLARVHLRHNVIRDCYGEYSAGAFAAVYCSLTVASCSMSDNFSDQWGGGGAIQDSWVSIVNTQFTGHYDAFAGALICSDSEGILDSCLFEDNGNSSEDPFAPCHLKMLDNTIPVTNCTFRGNIGGHRAIEVTDMAFEFVHNVVENHTAVDAIAGKVIMLQRVNGSRIAHNRFLNNTARFGLFDISMTNEMQIDHNVFSANETVAEQYGSALNIYGYYPFEWTVSENWFSNNGGQAISFDYWYPLNIENNYWGNFSGPYHPTMNPLGAGDSLLADSIDFIPWLTEPPDTTMLNAVDDRPRPNIPHTWQLMEVYPNPFNASVRIVLAGFANDDFEITLHNLLGQKVDVIHTGALTGGQLSYTAPPTLSSGVYFLQASDRRAVQSKKIVLLR